MKSIKYIVIHCSDTPYLKDFGVSDITRWHKERGFVTCGYHYVIRLDGTIELGRPEFMEGAHCKGVNCCSIGICYIGGRDCKGNFSDSRTSDQIVSLHSLVNDLLKRFPGARVVGHRDLCRYKVCPCFDVSKEF